MEAIRARTGTQETPPTLWAYAVEAVVSTLIALARTVGAHPVLAISALLSLLLIVLVLRGGRVIWCFFVAANALWILSSPASSQSWWSIVLAVIGLVCLLAPASRRFVWRPLPSPVPPTDLITGGADRDLAADGGAGGEPNNADASGWYIDPGSPWRMRHWNAEDQRWRGYTRTPRKLMKQWQQQKESERAD